MKQTYFIVAALSLAVSSSYGQGTIALANTASELVTINTTATKATSTTYGTALTVFYSATPIAAFTTTDYLTDDSTYQAWSQASLTTAGLLPTVKTSGQITGNTGFTVEPSTAGGNIWLEILGLANGTGTEVTGIQDSSIKFAGVSSMWSQATGNPTTVPAGTPVSTSGLFTGGINLLPIPEPSTIALAGLGAASLLLFRRRK